LGANRYPQKKPDRRLRSRARPDHSDRRQVPRYACDFVVDVHIGEGHRKKLHKAVARDISEGGVLLEFTDPPEINTDVRLDLRIPDGTMPERFLHGACRVKGRVLYRHDDKRQVGIAFERSLAEQLAAGVWYYLRSAALIGFLLAIFLILLIKIENVHSFWFDVPVFLYSLTVGFYLLSRFVFAKFYQPPAPRDDLPTVSVIIPAFNEEKHIEPTLVHAMECAYPADKIEIVAINDGSSDKTLEAMMRVRERYPELTVLDLNQRRGKRVALATGLRMTSGEIVVFVDSDSFLEPNAIRHIVDGFADPRVGAVCGHCEVENKWTNLLTKMQAVRYFISFRVLKAAESIFELVTCVSGPFAAYRREILVSIADEWVNQTYLGRPATFGDDRALTNLVLRHHKIIYDSRAWTTTIVPDGYSEFFRQQMRWKRSWFRETLQAASFIWRKQPFGSISFYLGMILPIISPAIVLRALVYLPVTYKISPLTYLFGVLLMSGLMSTTYLFIKRSRLWLYGLHFCFFYMMVLVWQLPWAIGTFARSHWGTRELTTFPSVELETRG
jgi:hyaluronan synthase